MRAHQLSKGKPVRPLMPSIVSTSYGFNYKDVKYIIEFLRAPVQFGRVAVYTCHVHHYSLGEQPMVVQVGNYLASARVIEYYEAEKIIWDYLNIDTEEDF